MPVKYWPHLSMTNFSVWNFGPSLSPGSGPCLVAPEKRDESGRRASSSARLYLTFIQGRLVIYLTCWRPPLLSEIASSRGTENILVRGMAVVASVATAAPECQRTPYVTSKLKPRKERFRPPGIHKT